MYLRARVQSSRLLPNATGSPPMVPSCSLMSYGRRRVGSCSWTCSPTSPADVSTTCVAKTNRKRRFNHDAKKTKNEKRGSNHVVQENRKRRFNHVAKSTQVYVLFKMKKRTRKDLSITLQNKHRNRRFNHIPKTNRECISLTLQRTTESGVSITLQSQIYSKNCFNHVGKKNRKQRFITLQLSRTKLEP